MTQESVGAPVRPHTFTHTVAAKSTLTFDIWSVEHPPVPTEGTNKLHLELPIGGLKTQPLTFVSKASSKLKIITQYFKNPTINRNISKIWGTSTSVYKIHSMAFWDFCPLGQNGEATDNQAASNLT